MASLSNVFNDVVSKWAITLFDAEELDKDGTQDNLVCAAPCSVYQSRPSFYDQGGSVYQSGSVYQNGSVYRDGSVYENGSVFQDGSVMQSGSVCQSGYHASSSQYAPQASPRIEPREQTLFHREPGLFKPTPLPDVPIIPFKDGTSLINIRPRGTQQEAPELNLRGGSWLKSDAYSARDKHFFISDPDDKVDVEVAEYFKVHPEVYLKTNFTRVRRGVYSMFDREVHVQWQESKNQEGKGRLTVRDGATKLPFADYMEMKSYSASVPDAMYNPYNSSVFKAKNALQMVPQEQRITFCDVGLDLSRQDAMKVAKEQATAREAAATDWLTKQARAPPQSTDRRRMSFGNAQLRSPSQQSRNAEMSPPLLSARGTAMPPPLISTTHVTPRCGSSFSMPPRCGNSFSIPATPSAGPPPRAGVRHSIPHSRLR